MGHWNVLFERTVMRLILGLLLEYRSTVAGTCACVLIAITLILRYGCDLWWPWGIVMATACGLIAMIGGATE